MKSSMEMSQTAGEMIGTGGSPQPDGFSLLDRIWTSTATGASKMYGGVNPSKFRCSWRLRVAKSVAAQRLRGLQPGVLEREERSLANSRIREPRYHWKRRNYEHWRDWNWRRWRSDHQEIEKRRLYSENGKCTRTQAQQTERDLALLDWSLLRDISKDGQNVLITEEGEGGGPNYSIYLRNISDATAIRLGEGDGWAISPDGKWVLAGSMTSPRVVYLLPTGAGEPRTLNAGNIHFESGTFAPDAQLVVFPGVDPSGGRHVYSMDMKGGALHAITPAGYHGLNGERMVSPHGKTVLVTDDSKWWLFPIGGGEGRAAFGVKPDDVIAGWATDGQSVYASTQTLPRCVDRPSGSGDASPGRGYIDDRRPCC